MTRSRIDQGLKLAICGLLVALAVVVVYTMREPNVDVGDSAPHFSIRTDGGARITPSDFGGKALILNFWAAWCAPCVEEAPSLNELHKMLGGSGLVILGISVDRKESMYSNFLKRFQIGFQTVRDPEENVNVRYGTYKFPESYIIDRNGKVLRKYAGLPERNGRAIEWTDPELVGFVKSLL
jgi:cytochrome c biogenesis protein CcmG, thiol:disulfide interchange protein DsbE